MKFTEVLLNAAVIFMHCLMSLTSKYPCAFLQMRMYRFGWLFEQLEINLSINLLWTTLFRNLLVRAPACHATASHDVPPGAQCLCLKNSLRRGWKR